MTTTTSFGANAAESYGAIIGDIAATRYVSDEETDQDSDFAQHFNATEFQGDSRLGSSKRALYESNSTNMVDRVRRVIVSPKRAACIAFAVFLGILSIALIAAFARPSTISCSTSCYVDSGQGNYFGEPSLTSTSSGGGGGGGEGGTSGGGGGDLGRLNSESPQSRVLFATNGEPFPWDGIRLPLFIIPIDYSIALHPNLTTFVNRGTVNVSFKVKQPSKFIVMHVKDLELDNFHLDTTSGGAKGAGNVRVLKTLICLKNEQLYVEFDTTLRADVIYSLSIDFRGNLTEKLEGFYLSSYRSSSGGELHYLATTHFEPTYARSAFPCFDEPSLKATFKVSIIREARHLSLFNMPVAQTQSLSDHLYVDYFDESVLMSTYLVAFVVCDYANLTARTAVGNLTVRVFAPREQIEQARFALEVATSVLDFYNEFFGIPYPLPKQDLIAIPDFGAGAMENWGLTTYRETVILTDPNETSVAKMQQVALTITHELAHQWFGNLVTMSWWNDLWLNEGFASFVENLGTAHVKSEWQMMDQFILGKTQPALYLDALASSHPISVPVHNPTDIESIFDTISYSKGASIIYMLESFLGKATLQSGLKMYLNKFKYTNAKTEELWRVLSQASKIMNVSVDVEEVMDTWTQQMGFPLVSIERQNGNRTVVARQQRFIVGSSAEMDGVASEYFSKYGYKWHVPLTCTTDKSSVPILIWMNLSDVEFTVDDEVSWLKCNTNQTGFYRVTYQEAAWRTLVQALKKNHLVFSAADRASLLDDAFTLIRNNMLNATIALEMTEYLVDERSYVPWMTAFENLLELEDVLRERPALRPLREHMRRLLRPIVKTVGWDEDSGDHLKRLLRPSVLYEAAHHEMPDTLNRAIKAFADWRFNGTVITPDLRAVVYTVGIRQGTYEDWLFCWNRLIETRVPSERAVLLNALGASTDPWVLSQYLMYSLEREKVRPQDTFIVLRAVSHNPVGLDLTWRFVRANWKTLVEQFGLGSFAMSNIIMDTTDQFYTEFDYHEVKSFFDSHEVGSGKRSVKTSLEKIRSKIQWLGANEEIVEKWLRDRSK